MANLSNINNKFLFTDGDFLLINGATANSISATESGIAIKNSNAATLSLQNSAANGKNHTLWSNTDGSFNITDIGVATRFTIASGGNVGIGTSSPDGNLEVIASTTVSGASDSVNNVLIGLQAANRPTVILDTADTTYTNRTWNITNVGSAGSLFFGRNGLDVLVMKNDGKIGIKETAPATLLSLAGLKNEPIITLKSTTNDSNWTAGDVIGGINFRSEDGSGAGAGIKGSISYIATSSSGGSTAMTFNTASSATNNIERVRIDASGRVGIGITSPTYGLEIDGADFAGDAFSTTRGTSRFYILNANNSYGVLGMQSNHDLHIRTNATTRMLINSSGNVGINTTSPSTRLHIDQPSNDRAGGLYIERNGSSYGLAAFVNSGGYGIIGGGGSYANDVISIDFNNAYVGIGAASPDFALDIEALDSGVQLQIGRTNTNVGSTWMGSDSNGFHLGVGAYGSGNSVSDPNGFTVNTSGKLGIGTASPDKRLTVGGVNATEGINLKTKSGSNVWTIWSVEQYFSQEGYMRLFYDNVSKIQFRADGDSFFNGGDVGIGTTAPRAKLEVNGELIAQDIKHSNYSVGSLNTTGVTVATITGAGNGSSAQIEFIGMGGTSGIVDVVYSCTNQGGNWYAYKKARQTPTIVDVDVSGHGTTTLTFTFKSLSGSAAYTPRLMMKGSPSALVTF